MAISEPDLHNNGVDIHGFQYRSTHITARMSQHAYHSSHVTARISEHACWSTHIEARISKHAYWSTERERQRGAGETPPAGFFPAGSGAAAGRIRTLRGVGEAPVFSVGVSARRARRRRSTAWAPRAEMRCCDLLGASGHAVGHVIPGAPALPDAPGNSGKSPGAWDIAPPTERERQRGAGLEGERRGTRPCPLLSLPRHLVPLCFRSQSRSL